MITYYLSNSPSGANCHRQYLSRHQTLLPKELYQRATKQCFRTYLASIALQEKIETFVSCPRCREPTKGNQWISCEKCADCHQSASKFVKDGLYFVESLLEYSLRSTLERKATELAVLQYQDKINEPCSGTSVLTDK